MAKVCRLRCPTLPFVAFTGSLQTFRGPAPLTPHLGGRTYDRQEALEAGSRERADYIVVSGFLQALARTNTFELGDKLRVRLAVA